MELQRVGHNWATELNWTELRRACFIGDCLFTVTSQGLLVSESLLERWWEFCWSPLRKHRLRSSHSWEFLLARKPWAWFHAKPLQSCLTMCDPMDCSLSGSSVCGILQAKILEWVAMPSSKGSYRPRDRTWVSCLLHWQTVSLLPAPPGKLHSYYRGFINKCTEIDGQKIIYHF